MQQFEQKPVPADIQSQIGTVPSGKNLQGEIDTLNSKIEKVEYSTSTIGVSGIVTSYVKAGIAFLKVYDLIRTSSGTVTLGTLPSALRPSQGWYGIITQEAASKTAEVKIDSNGGITAYGLEANKYYYGCLSFPL